MHFVLNLVVFESSQGQATALRVEERERCQQLEHLHLHHHVGRVQSCGGQGRDRGEVKLDLKLSQTINLSSLSPISSAN